MKASYSFEQFVLLLESERPALQQQADRVLRYHRFRPGQQNATPDWTLRLSPATHDDPAWPVVFETASCRLLAGASGWWLRYGPVAFRGQGTELDGYVPSGVEARPEFAFGLVLAVSLLLREKGWFGLHAAGLVWRNSGVLLVGRSDSGKSTLAYSLVRRGWSYLTDDAVLVHRSGEDVVAVSFREDFGLDPESVRYFPEVAACPDRQPTDPAKLRVRMDRLHPGRFQPRCRPVLLIFPELADIPESRLVPLRRSEAFGRLVQASLLLGRADDPAERRLLDVMGRLVRQAPAYLLEAGPDLLDRPGRLEQMLAAAFPESSVSVHQTSA
ncbi:serine kinase [Rhodothermus marinus]|uniref:serine kinase n=1 Tax=Rhodothermus marinus TaxID=29549 RepID=UPI0006D09572|nr:serine kinase [Rhodothermus marinus]